MIRIKSNLKTLIPLSAMAFLLPSLLGAHPAGGTGLLSGAVHPLTGMDHFIAMVAVGILSVQKGGSLKAPLVFIGFMVIGSLLAFMNFRIPGVEMGIAMSLLVLGAAIASSMRAIPAVLSLGIIAVFAMFHGHAHGEEIPAMSNPAVYAMGFVLSTAALHMTGILIGTLALRHNTAYRVLRLAGVAMSFTGAVLLIGV